MTMNIVARAPLAALRRSVFGFLIGSGLGTAFVALVFVFDLGPLAASAMRSGGSSVFDLALLPVTFGLLGLVVGPSLGSALGSDAS